MKVELNFLEKFNLAKICLEVFLAFVRSDAIRLDNGNIGYAGGNGYAWSRIAISLINTYYLNFNTTGVNPSSSGDYWFGFPLRCLYPGSA